MARRLKVTGGVLNIRLHPHPPGIYGAYIEALYALKRPVKVWGDRYAMLSLLNRSEEESGLYTGFLTTFTSIDFDQPWFDTTEMDEAKSNKISQIQIPDGLYPNAATFSFLFDTNEHRFYVQTYSDGRTLSINSAHTLLTRLSDNLSITKRFNEAKITIAQSRNALKSAFELPIIKRVVITLEAPNADILQDDFDEKIEQYMEDLNAKRLTLIYEAESGKSVKPTEQLKRLGESAIEHGSVRVEGRDASGATQRSTENFPRELHDKYDPDHETESQAFRRLTGK